MRTILILLGMLAILTVGAYFALSFYAVRLIQPRIQKVIGPEITISDIQVRMTHLSLKEIQYEDLGSKRRIFQIEEIKVYPSLLSLLMGRLRVKEFVLYKPSFFLSRSREKTHWIPWTGMIGKEEKRDDLGEGRKRKSLPLKVDQIKVQSGSVDFEDRKIGDPPAQINLRELEIRIKGIEFPFVPIPFSFLLNGKVKGMGREGSMKMEGWLNPKAIEFESLLSVWGIGVKVFEPYYRKKVSAEVKDGLIHIEAKIVLRKRVVEIQGEMELVDLQISGKEGKVFWIPADLFSSQLRKKGGRLKIPFHIKGDLNDPKFNLKEAVLIALGLSLVESLGMPVKILEGKEGLKIKKLHRALSIGEKDLMTGSLRYDLCFHLSRARLNQGT